VRALGAGVIDGLRSAVREALADAVRQAVQQVVRDVLETAAVGAVIGLAVDTLAHKGAQAIGQAATAGIEHTVQTAFEVRVRA
jgi:hypothetical protein